MIVIFSGVIGRLPVGGHAWIAMQYLASLKELGHDVYFLEDAGPESWVYDWETEKVTSELGYPSGYARDCLEGIGLANRWIYRAGDRAAGMPVDEFRDVCKRADLLIIWAVPITPWRPEYDLPRRRAYIDADPGFTQISLVTGHAELANTVSRCETVFTIAQRIGAADCPIPAAGRTWHRTLAPVSLTHWPVAEGDPGAAGSAGGDATRFTSVMQWRGFREVVYEGKTYGQKDREFPNFLELPRLTSQPLRIALTGAAPEDLTAHGWEVVPGWVQSKTPWSYRQFIQQSRAEFGVAKHGYVAMRGGWFSDRSVCYLASGRPALLQDTGLADWLPIGEGIVTFQDVAAAARGIDVINADYHRHRRAARRLAEEYFDARRVLPPLLEIAAS